MDLKICMNQAFDNYFDLSKKLSSDVEMFLEVTNQDISLQRNFVRTLVAVIEGYNHCIREIAVIGLNYGVPGLLKKEQQAMKSETNFGISERFKYTLKGSYRMFKLYPLPDFGTENWENAKEGLNWRHRLSHPKFATDLEVTPESWSRIEPGLVWLFEQHCNFFSLLFEKFDK